MRDRTPIFRSLAVIEERIQEKLTVEMLAESIHFSRYHYQRMFREVVGDSVMAYVTRRKLALAAEELTRTGGTVLEVALKYGYDSHEGFTRSFKAYLGITPTEFRKYHPSVCFPGVREERSAMLYSKTTEEMIRKLNGLIVEAGETAVYIRKNKGKGGEGTAAYETFWEHVAHRADKLAEQLKESLGRVTAIAECPDEISTRFFIIKAIEDAAFESALMAFQTGLMTARAMPEHREAFRPLCNQCNTLAQHARLEAEAIADFFNELTSLIFQDMRQRAQIRIQHAADVGKEAALKLSDPMCPYAYIVDEVQQIAVSLSNMPLEEITVYSLEEYRIRLENVASAADMDSLRAPSQKHLFEGISNFRQQLDEVITFFERLPEETVRMSGQTEVKRDSARSTEKMYADLAFQERILLFYLKGEIEKLGKAELISDRKAAFDKICMKLEEAVGLASAAGNTRAASKSEKMGAAWDAEERETAEGESRENAVEMAEAGNVAGEGRRRNMGRVTALLREVYSELTEEAGQLGVYGGAIQYMAEEIQRPLRHFSE